MASLFRKTVTRYFDAEGNRATKNSPGAKKKKIARQSHASRQLAAAAEQLPFGCVLFSVKRLLLIG